jgi:hypothetical protein
LQSQRVKVFWNGTLCCWFGVLGFLSHWRWRDFIPFEHLETPTQQHSITSWMLRVLSNAAVETSNLTL